MKFISYLILIFFLNFSIYAKGIECLFEEVYTSGEIQQGLLLIDNDKLRYEYFDKNLFTILVVNNKLFLIDNTNRTQVQLIEDQNSPVPQLLNIYKDFPNIKNSYLLNGNKFLIEKNNNNFVKRIGINTPKLNLSIYFNQCKTSNLSNNLFNFNPFVEYD
tara:strand:- start:3 stop:482 length:480 start_codon:yes stop_codon:yes gene_type:complete